jgi:hypothetical protein
MKGYPLHSPKPRIQLTFQDVEGGVTVYEAFVRPGMSKMNRRAKITANRGLRNSIIGGYSRPPVPLTGSLVI